MNRKEQLEAIRRAASAYGAKTRLAEVLGYSRPTVHNKLKQEDGFTDQELATASVALGVAIQGPPLSDERLNSISVTLKGTIQTYEEAVREFGWEPPPAVAENIKSLMFDARISGAKVERVVQLLDALKRWHNSREIN